MKVAISVPDPVFSAAEHLAKQLKVSRSELYSTALAAYLDARGSASVTAKLNAIYASESSQVEPGLAEAQARSITDETW